MLLLAGGALACAAANAQDAARGRMLAEDIATCQLCHQARRADGSVDAQGGLAGGWKMRVGALAATATNITSDADTGLGRWSDEQILTALREGRRPDGSTLHIMPSTWYRGMADDDARAIVAWLRTLAPVANTAAAAGDATAGGLPAGPQPTATATTTPRKRTAAPARDDTVAYGRYLATAVGLCMRCHTGIEDSTPADLDTAAGSGGRAYGAAVAANITPHESGLAGWTDAEIEAAIRQGRRRDGSRLKPPMPYASYARWPAEEMQALIAYLRSLPPRPVARP